MPGALLTEWMAYDEFEPFGPPADFFRAGVIAATVRNAQRAKSSDPVASPHDFYPPLLHEEARDRMNAGHDNEQTLGEFAERQQAAEVQRRGR